MSTVTFFLAIRDEFQWDQNPQTEHVVDDQKEVVAIANYYWYNQGKYYLAKSKK